MRQGEYVQAANILHKVHETVMKLRFNLDKQLENQKITFKWGFYESQVWYDRGQDSGFWKGFKWGAAAGIVFSIIVAIFVLSLNR